MTKRKKKKPAPEMPELIDMVFKKWKTKKGKQEYQALTAPLLAERREQYHIRPDELHAHRMTRH